MTRAEIKAFFPTNFPIQFGGLNYAVPTVKVLTGAIYSAFWQDLRIKGVAQWANKFQCRDFARAFANYCQYSNLAAQNTPDGDDAAAVGEFWFRPDGAPLGSDHAINVCITDQGLTFIEPQTGQVRPVSQNELFSCAFCRF